MQTIAGIFLPEFHSSPLEQNPMEMSFGLLEMIFRQLSKHHSTVLPSLETPLHRAANPNSRSTLIETPHHRAAKS